MAINCCATFYGLPIPEAPAHALRRHHDRESSGVGQPWHNETRERMRHLRERIDEQRARLIRALGHDEKTADEKKASLAAELWRLGRELARAQEPGLWTMSTGWR